MIAYRYTIDEGRHGGIVFANNEDEADEKLAQFYGDDIEGSFVEIWKWEDDDYYKPIPGVYDCYGE